MKQKIGSMVPEDQKVTDIQGLFTAVFNLVYEKIQQEPNKGIVVCKGKKNQRKFTWEQIMYLAHEMEDYFVFREMRIGHRICQDCEHWASISAQTPYMGRCSYHNKTCIHALHCCKKWVQRNEL